MVREWRENGHRMIRERSENSQRIVRVFSGRSLNKFRYGYAEKRTILSEIFFF